MQNIDSLPTPTLSVTVDTVATSMGTSHDTLEISVIGSNGQCPGSGDDEEDASTRIRKEGLATTDLVA